MSGENLGYSAFKIFVILFILTALEVWWGMTFRPDAGYSRLLLWGGLMCFAVAKGLLIFMYFMHMRFERWIVWALIVPTPALILVILFALMPDVSFNEQRDHPVGDMLDPRGRVVDMVTRDLERHDTAAAEPGSE